MRAGGRDLLHPKGKVKLGVVRSVNSIDSADTNYRPGDRQFYAVSTAVPRGVALRTEDAPRLLRWLEY